MTLLQLRTLVRAFVPGAKIAVVTDAVLDLLINKATDDLNEFGLLLESSASFDIVANQSQYNFSDIAPDFYKMDKTGIEWNQVDNTNPDWKEIRPVNKLWLRKYRPNWRTESAGSPEVYWADQNAIYLIAKPEDSLTDGGIINYIAKSIYMTDSGHYPFSGSTTEITALRGLDDAIIDYCRWKLTAVLGKVEVAGLISQKEYTEQRREKINLVKSRIDIMSDRNYGYKIPLARAMGRKRR